MQIAIIKNTVECVWGNRQEIAALHLYNSPAQPYTTTALGKIISFLIIVFMPPGAFIRIEVCYC